METIISVILIFMILGAIYALHARDLLSALISCGLVGYGLVICFLLLRAPDVAIVQIVIETITLIIMVSVVLASTRHEIEADAGQTGKTGIYKIWGSMAMVMIIMLVMFFTFRLAIIHLDPFGDHTLRMSRAYLEGAAERTGSANLVTGVLFDFRGYDTFGEATILFTAVIGVLTVLRLRGKK
jgi:multisubunit Na+/H+ antiporter MnhB subunit